MRVLSCATASDKRLPEGDSFPSTVGDGEGERGVVIHRLPALVHILTRSELKYIGSLMELSSFCWKFLRWGHANLFIIDLSVGQENLNLSELFL